MANLYGHQWTKDDLRRRCGTFNQIAGCTRYRLTEGMERDVEICDIRTGSGFRFCASPSRGMDITFAEYNGRPLCWNSSTGVTHPAYYSEYNWGWLRGFYGGWVTTCGFSSFSSPCEDGNEYYGLHDRASYIPATNVVTEGKWITENGEDHYEISCSGIVRETRVFGPNITLHRRISTRLGENKFIIDDTIENEGFEPQPWVILYHCNFGFPIVSEDSIIRAPSAEMNTRDLPDATADTWNQLEPSQPGIAERCYFHTMKPDANGIVRASIHNKKLNFGAYLQYRFDELPAFTQWKMMGGGAYVCGLEPSNVDLKTRTVLKESGNLPIIQPGEQKKIRIELGVDA